MRDNSGSQGLAFNGSKAGRSAVPGISRGRLAAVRSRLRSGEISVSKQAGDAESMINEEPNVMQPGGSSEWLE